MKPQFQLLPNQKQFNARAPFPHARVDGFLSPDDVVRINEQWPDADEQRRQEKDTTKKLNTQELPPAARELADAMMSRECLDALEKATGIPNLVADETMAGGGIHTIERGGFLNAHVDYNTRHMKTRGPQEIGGLYRRLNVLIYLNEMWREEWGGHLHLYRAPSIKKLEFGEETEHPEPLVSIPPICGTMAMFATSEWSWHGHPEPLKCPEGVQRRSMAFYYYSPEPPVGYTGKHTTIYLERLLK